MILPHKQRLLVTQKLMYLLVKNCSSITI